MESKNRPSPRRARHQDKRQRAIQTTTWRARNSKLSRQRSVTTILCYLKLGLTQNLTSPQSLGFHALAGDAKVRLTPKWSPPPPPTASLLTIASRKAIIAAAGPDALIIASTDSVRKAFGNDKNGDSEVRPFDAEIKIPMPARISHLAFTADEQFLIMSAEKGGGLAIYETQTLLQGSDKSAFEINTSGESVKMLVPNPMAELAEFCAVVTTNGRLLMASLKEKALAQGPNGPVLRANVTSVGWSTKGKQLVAGMADGTIAQMAPDGTEKAALIPRPPSLGDSHVASVTWLENNLFLAIYNENTGSPPNSDYFVITRNAPKGETPTFEFRKLTDPVMPYGNDAAPQYVILRVRDYPPAIQELLIVSSSVSDQLGLLTKAKAPLTTDRPADEITSVFTMTEFADDSRRAALPSDENLNDTFPIGVALDLSSKDKIYKPVPADEEIEFSPGPVPAAWALNNDGILAAWWMVYYDAVRQGTTYSGMAALQSEPTSKSSAPASTTSAFGSEPPSTPFRSSSAFSTAAPALASSTAVSNPFGVATTTPGPSFGAPAFGATSGLGAKPAFGQSAGLGNKSSPWASASSGAAPAFGSHGFSSSAAPTTGGATSGKVFGSSAASGGSTAGSGFAGLAGQSSGFASLGGNNKGMSAFSQPSSSPFGASSGGPSAFGGGNQSVFGQSTGTGVFGSQQASSGLSSNPVGSTVGSAPFILRSTFEADPISANDNEKPSGKSGFNLGGISLSLGDEASKPAEVNETTDENMGVATPVEPEKPKSQFGQPQESTTPSSTPAPSKFFSAQDTTPKANPFEGPATTSNVFGTAKLQPSVSKPNPFAQAEMDTPKSRSGLFGSTFGEGGDKPKANLGLFGSVSGGSAEKPNPFLSTTTANKPGATQGGDIPLPPDTTSKAAYPFGDSSQSSIASTKTTEDNKKATESVGDAPLPPDFLAPKGQSGPDGARAPPPLPKDDSPVPEDAPLPPDFVTKPKPDSKSLFDPPAAPTVPESPDDDLSEDYTDEGDGSEVGEEEDGDDDGGDEEDGEGGSEGSGVDVAKDLSSGSVDAGRNSGITPQSSFGGMGGSTFSLISNPDAAQPARRSLFGEQPRAAPFGGNAPTLPKPTVTSPGSPSPVRSAVPARVVGESSRSVSAPGYGKSISSRIQPKEDPNVALQKEAQKRQEEQQQRLEDEEYEQVQALLGSPVEPTLDIGEFNAFNSVTADAHASTVAAQVEALYRDMNGMLVTLGLNARALAGFIKGHEGRRTSDFKSKHDLESPDDWVLCEAEDLNHILDEELASELENGRVQDIDDTWDTCQSILREVPKLRAKRQDLKRILDTVLDPDQAAAIRTMPLSAEQLAQQNELRQAYARTSKLLAEAEDALTMLKTKLASLSGKPSDVPTVDRIMRTIAKMTSSFEKRSGEIDILESQMRKLRMSGSLGPSPSREGSPVVTRTPPSNKRQSLILARSTTHSPSPLRARGSSLNGSTSRAGGPSPRKKISGFNEDDKDAIREKLRNRQTVLDRLRSKLVENGPKVSRMGDAPR